MPSGRHPICNVAIVVVAVIAAATATTIAATKQVWLTMAPCSDGPLQRGTRSPGMSTKATTCQPRRAHPRRALAVGMRAQAAWAQCNSRSHSQQCRAMDKSCRRMGLAVGRRAQAAWAWVQQQKPCTAVQGNGHTMLHMHSGLCSASVEYRCAGVASMRCACTAFCVQCHAAYCFPGLVSILPVCARRHHFHEDTVEVPLLLEWPCRRR